MKYFSIIALTIFWIMLHIFSHYVLIWFFKPFVWLGINLILLIYIIIRLTKIFYEKSYFRREWIKLGVSIVLLVSNIFFIPYKVIEKVDWIVLESERERVVEDVLSEKLRPNVSHNQELCELGKDYKTVSNGGNEIIILKKEEGSYTIKFWIDRGFFENPQPFFIFTNNSDMQEKLEQRIIQSPDDNWKIKENWYRILER